MNKVRQQMRVNDIVYLKSYKDMMGRIISISDEDSAVISLCDTGMRIIVNLCDLEKTTKIQPEREAETYVDILGTQYKIVILEENDYRVVDNENGWCDFSAKKIVTFNFKQDRASVENLAGYQKEVIRHEIIHAFLHESGLGGCADSTDHWAMSEEMVDWFAKQEPKIHRAFVEAGCAEIF